MTFDDNATALRELRFVPQDEEQPQFENDPEYCLRQLHDQISDDHDCLLLLLDTDDPNIIAASAIERLKRTKNHELIPFPIKMTVSDACITNSPYAWFYKHNYTLLYMLNSY